MGLDMYLSAKRYVRKHDGWGPEAPSNPTFEKIVDGSKLSDYCEDPSVDIYGATVSVNVAYWRKANQIHQWFVDNCQNGVDECQEVYVSEEQLEELRGICNEILANKDDKSMAEELLPPAEGFFFGSNDIDEWYYQDIQYTADRLKAVLELAKQDRDNENYITFSYQSSW